MRSASTNQDLVTPANSWNRWVGVNSPKATITFFPDGILVRPAGRVQLWEVVLHRRSEWDRLWASRPQPEPGSRRPGGDGAVVSVGGEQAFHKTDLKLTLGHETQTAEYGKIDPDTGLQFDLGPGRIRYMAATLRQGFRWGPLLATFEQADARDLDTGQVTPEAPRLIGDLSWTYQKLPFHLQVKGEFEYVGRKVVGNGCDASNPNDLTSYCLGVPNKEFRLARGAAIS